MDTPRTREERNDALDSITDQIDEGLLSGKFSAHELQTMLMERTRAAAHETDRLVHENPWIALGIAAGLGLAIGLMIPRSDSSRGYYA